MKKTALKLLLLLTITVLQFTNTFAQCSGNGLASDGSTSGNGRAPNSRFRNVRTVYFISAAEMTASGVINGTAINGIGWLNTVAPGLAATGTLDIYLKNTTDVTYSMGTNFPTAISTMTLVNTGAYTIPNTLVQDIPTFTGGSAFTYTGGGVYVAFDWAYCAGTLSATQTVACNTTSMATNQLSGIQSAAACSALVTTGASLFRPATKFFYSCPANDAQVSLIYTLGSLRLNYSNNTIIKARVTNGSAGTLTNLPVTLALSGANTFNDVQTVASLASGASTIVSFAAFTPSALGTNTLLVSVPADDNNANNSATITQNVTSGNFSFKYPGTSSSGGVGFNGNAGVFVGKFTTTYPALLHQVNVDITTAGQPYKVAVYGDNAGQPGALLYEDATVRTAVAGADVAVIPGNLLLAAGNFYVGIEQTATTNINYSYNTEAPIRSNTFFYSSVLPAGAWTDFNSTSANFRLNLDVNMLPVPPNCVTAMSPANATTGTCSTTNLTWTDGGSTGIPTSGYDVYFGTSATPPLVSANQAGLSYSTTGLAPNTQYFWQVVALNADGAATGCAVNSFTTGIPVAVSNPGSFSVANDAGSCNAAVSYSAVTSGSSAVTTYSFSGATTGSGSGNGSGAVFNQGVTNVDITATNSCGTVTESFTITVNDTEAPSIASNSDITQSNDAGMCSAVVTFTSPLATDNCGAATVVCTPASGSTFASGSTTVNCMATDAHGNTASSTFTVTVNDTEAPSIATNADITQSNDAGMCSAVVSFTSPLATDNCTGTTVVCTPASGSTFAAGSTTVNCVATDASGNTASSSFTVTVNDTEAPVISGNSATANSSDDATGDCAFTSGSVGPNVGSYTISGDNCSSSFTVQEDFFFNGNPDGTATWTLGAGTWFPIHTYQVGVTTVNVTVTDAAGNVSTTSYTQTVIDNEAPIITVAAQDMTVQDDGAGNIADFNDWLITNWGNADATDNCTPGYILDYYWYNDYNPNNWVTGCGNTKSVYVGFYVHDISGNWSNWTYATFTIADNTAPVVTAPTDVTFCSASIGSIGTATATDNSLSTPLITNDAPASFPLGLTIVTWTATDACGNTATAAQNVMINATPVGSASNIVICNGDPSNVALNSSEAGSTFTWTSAVILGGVIGNNDCASGCGTTIADVLTNTGNVHGIVEYTVTPTSGLGCVGSPFAVDVTVGAAPATPSAISGPNAICGLTTATYSVPPLPEATNYTWTVTTGSSMITIVSGQGTPSINVNIGTGNLNLFTITVVASNNCGNSGTTTINMTKKPSVPGAISGPTSTCGQTSATYSIAPVFGATSYIWTVPAGMSITNGQGTTTVNVSMTSAFITGIVKVSASNACGFVPGATLTITGNVPAVPVSLSGPANVCGLTSATYSVPAVAGATGYNWTITGTGNSISGSNTGSTVTTVLAGPGTISCAATNLCGNGTARSLNLVTSGVQPGIITGPLNTCGLTVATYSVAPVANAATYNWTLASGMTWATGQGTNVISVNIAPSVGTVTATSTLKLTETNTCGNTSLFRSTTITRCLSPDVLNTESGNTFSSVYPNPTSAEFTMGVTLDKNQEIVMEVFDILGNIVISEKHNLVSGTSTMKTSLEQFNSGIYFVRLIDANSNVLHTERVVKQ